jgi:hypothetical protein
VRDGVVLHGAFGEEFILTSWMDATRFQRACAVDHHSVGSVFHRLTFLNRHVFEQHRSNILSLTDMSSPLGSRRMSDGELHQMILDHLTRSGRLILVDEGPHLQPCGIGPKREASELTGPPDAGPGWSGDARSWSQEKKYQSMHPELRAPVKAVIEALAKRGFHPEICYGWRSVAKQAEIVKKGSSPVTFSFHNIQKKHGTPDSYAADIIDHRWGWQPPAMANGFWKALGEEANKQNLYWGGVWKDKHGKPKPDWAHVQLVPVSQLKRFRKASGL